MKKQILSAIVAFVVANAFAQDLTSKKGENYLPEEGDWAISVDASPFLNYFGNLLGSDGNSAPSFQFLNGTAITGKYFKDANTAYRISLRLGMNSGSITSEISKDGATAPTFPALGETVEDVYRFSSGGVVIGVGLEKRRGSTRLQGFYGGQAMIMTGGGFRARYEYGNEMTTTNLNPTTTNFGIIDLFEDFSTGTNVSPAGFIAPYGGRITEYRRSGSIGFGVRGFIGAEYFIVPKISLAGEVGWGIGISSGGKISATSETNDGTTIATVERKDESRFSGMRIDTETFNFGMPVSGTISINFHF
ncbi:MAG: hypothetical protein ACK4GL_06615 [Flavobacteriales bacterium]